MFKKIVLIFTFITIILLTVASASAQELNNTGVLDVNITHDEVILDFDDLSQRINDTPQNGQLILDRDYQFVNGSNKGIMIDKSITIDGNGHTLNGNHLSRIFNITASNVTLKNINFVNGKTLAKYFSNDAGGGSIYWNGDNGRVENCNFTNNTLIDIEDDPYDKEEITVTEDGRTIVTIRARPMGAKITEGGAIVWNGTNGVVKDCIFADNEVGYPNYGGAICWRGDNGTVLSSEFYNNGAWCGAAICWVGNNGKVLSSKFYDNEFMDKGIYWFGDNGLVKNSILIGTDKISALRGSGENLSADYNFWGDTIGNPNKLPMCGDVKKWYVLDSKTNNGQVKEGDKFLLYCYSEILLDDDNNIDQYGSAVKNSKKSVYASSKGLIEQDIDIDVTAPTIKFTANKDITKYYKSSVNFKVRVYVDGKLAVGKKVTFKINNHVYKAKTDSKGYATLKLTQKPGKYTVWTSYENVKVKNKITIKTTLITKDTTKKFKKTGKFAVKVINTKGKPLAKKVVKVKFKGKTYKIKTNKKGIATFSIPKNLKIGKHSIKTMYNGLANYNKIVVKR